MTDQRLVLIEWEDSCGCSSSWQEIPNELTPEISLCKSVGWIVFDGEDCKLIVPHIANFPTQNQQGCGDMTIPVSAIRRIVELTEQGEDNDQN